MCQGVILGIVYVIFQFYIPCWVLILEFILAFAPSKWMHYVTMASRGIAFDIALAKSTRACKLQWFLLMRSAQNKISHTCTRTFLDVIVGMGCFILWFPSFAESSHVESILTAFVLHDAAVNWGNMGLCPTVFELVVVGIKDVIFAVFCHTVATPLRAFLT